jgi:hypothetical protein
MQTAIGFFLILLIMVVPIPPSFGEVFVCPQPDGFDLYTDRNGPKCRLRESSSSPPVGPRAIPGLSAKPLVRPVPLRSTEHIKGLDHRPFESITMQFAALNYYGGSGDNYYVPTAGEVMREELNIRYLASGAGPKIVSLAELDSSARGGLAVAVVAASNAVGYDAAYMEIHYDPVPHLKGVFDQLKDLPANMRPHVAGNSASGIWAVAIAAGILGDPLRSDICMTGSVEDDARIGFVGKVDHKIYGCAKDRYREMVIPFGQKDINLVGIGMSLGLTITEVRTLGEAYEILTGKSLRPLSH